MLVKGVFPAGKKFSPVSAKSHQVLTREFNSVQGLFITSSRSLNPISPQLPRQHSNTTWDVHSSLVLSKSDLRRKTYKLCPLRLVNVIRKCFQLVCCATVCFDHFWTKKFMKWICSGSIAADSRKCMIRIMFPPLDPDKNIRSVCYPRSWPRG